MCKQHRDSVLPLSTDQLRARPGQGLCGEGFLLLHAADVVVADGEEKDGTAVACSGCGAALGCVAKGEGGKVSQQSKQASTQDAWAFVYIPTPRSSNQTRTRPTSAFGAACSGCWPLLPLLLCLAAS